MKEWFLGGKKNWKRIFVQGNLFIDERVLGSIWSNFMCRDLDTWFLGERRFSGKVGIDRWKRMVYWSGGIFKVIDKRVILMRPRFLFGKRGILREKE